MVEIFNNTLQNLAPSSSKVLLAISGGLDSTVLAHLFHLARQPFALAHCNFGLRGEESDAEEIFVQELGESLGVPVYTTRFDTKRIAEVSKTSIQVAARDLRYDWLELIRSQNGFDYIATAHHMDDSIETVLYNFTMGCGIRGLHGIPKKNGFVIRPLLEVHREEIRAFAEYHHLQYKEDSSNFTTKYSRNKLRHSVIPVLEEINPSFRQTGGKNIRKMAEMEDLLDYVLDEIRQRAVSRRQGKIYMDMAVIRRYPARITILFELLREFGFNSGHAAQIHESMDGQPGKLFFSHSHRVVLDRDELIITPKEVGVREVRLDYSPEGEISVGAGKLTWMVCSYPKALKVGKSVAYVDADCLKFPLILRSWVAGDWFCPIGMQGKKKKIKNLFSDLKMSIPEKEEALLLESEGKICWVVGIRPDERFKLKEETKNVIRFEWKNETADCGESR